MFDEIKRFAEQNSMIRRGDRIVAGVSGGADSVCLLLFLNSLKDELGLEIFAVHVNHGVRGEEADRDEDFTTKLCERLSIPCTVATRDVPAAAKLSGRSEEEEGRLARYEAFEEECKRRYCSKIAVAHNRDDNAETVLLNLARGSGLHGLCGIRPVSKRKSGITVIRPLLCVDKQRITGFLEGRGEPFCFDSTNATDDYSRNYIRNNILPAFEERINSQASLHIALAAQTLSEADDFICAERDGAMRKLEESGVLKLAGDAAVISSEALTSFHPLIRREIVRDLLGRVAGRLKDITAAHVAEVAELAGAQSGKSVSLPYGMVARNDFGKITIKVYHGEGEPRKYGHIEYCVKDRDADIPVPKNDCIKWFDYDKIIDGVETRTLRDGDYIRVKKQGGDGLGKKLVRDVLMELKVPTPEREKVPLLASGSHVLWIGGMRGSDDLRVDSGTKRVLEAVYVEEADRR